MGLGLLTGFLAVPSRVSVCSPCPPLLLLQRRHPLASGQEPSVHVVPYPVHSYVLHARAYVFMHVHTYVQPGRIDRGINCDAWTRFVYFWVGRWRLSWTGGGLEIGCGEMGKGSPGLSDFVCEGTKDRGRARYYRRLVAMQDFGKVI